MAQINETSTYSKWKRGNDYKVKLRIEKEEKASINFLEGRHWEGLSAKAKQAVPPVKVNMCRQIGYGIKSFVVAEDLKFDPKPHAKFPEPDMETELANATENLKNLMNRFKKKRGLMDKLSKVYDYAMAGGTGYVYFPWDSMPWQDSKGKFIHGDLDVKALSVMQVVLGNPLETEIDLQPYVIIGYRESVERIKEIAMTVGGMSETEAEKIHADSQGDDFKGSVFETGGEGVPMATFMIEFYRNPEDSKIYTKMATRSVEIAEDIPTRLNCYPIAPMVHIDRFFSAYGISGIYHLIPAQIQINQILAMNSVAIKNHAYSRLFVDATRISRLTNSLTSVQFVEGDPNNIVKQLQGQAPSESTTRSVDYLLSITKDSVGLNESFLGEGSARNASAQLAKSTQSQQQLAQPKANYRSCMERCGKVILDIMKNRYDVPMTVAGIDDEGEMVSIIDFNPNDFADVEFDVDVELTVTSKYNEIISQQSYDMLLQSHAITFEQWLQISSDEAIPKRQFLLNNLEQSDVRNMVIKETLADFVASLQEQEPELYAQIVSMAEQDPEQMEDFVLNLYAERLRQADDQRQLQIQQQQEAPAEEVPA